MTASDIRNVQADGAEPVGDEAATTDARPRLPHLNRTDPPAYLQNYLNREAQVGNGTSLTAGPLPTPVALTTRLCICVAFVIASPAPILWRAHCRSGRGKTSV